MLSVAVEEESLSAALIANDGVLVSEVIKIPINSGGESEALEQAREALNAGSLIGTTVSAVQGTLSSLLISSYTL